MKDRQTLSLVESARLVALIEKEYAEMALTDEGFAEYARSKVGEKVTRTAVTNRRLELGIPSSKEALKERAGVDLSTLVLRLEACERQLAADQKEFRGLAALVIDYGVAIKALEKAARLKGTFEVPAERPNALS